MSLVCLGVYSISALTVICLTPFVRSYALSLGRTDLPSERKVHREPIVRFGGVSIFLGCLVGLVPAIAVLGNQLQFSEHWSLTLFVLGGTAFFGLGLADDFLDLSPILRLFCQLSISAAVWQAGLRIDLSSILPWDPSLLVYLSCFVTVLWLAGVANAVNWIDGLDGLASGVCAVGAFGIIVVALVEQQQLPLLLAAGLLGSLSGFLKYNSNPAQIFMGDGGSYFIGFSVAALCLLGPLQVEGGLGIWLALAVVALPVLDMLLVISSRLLQGHSPFEADQSHLHHRLLALGFSHRTCVEALCLLSLLLTGSLLTASPHISWMLYGILCIAVILIVIWKFATSKSIGGLFSLNADVANSIHDS